MKIVLNCNKIISYEFRKIIAMLYRQQLTVLINEEILNR